MSDFEDISFILQDGPCFPSNANVNMFKEAGQDIITITNTSPIDCANTLGILTSTFVVVRDQEYSVKTNSRGKEISYILFGDFSNNKIFEKTGFIIQVDKINESMREFSDFGRPLDFKSIDHIVLDIPQEINVEKFDSTLTKIKEFLNLKKESYIGLQLSHFNFNQICEYFNIKKAVKFTSEKSINQDLPELLLCSLKSDEDLELLVIKGIVVHQTTMDPASRSMPTRILHNLGVNKFALFSNIYSANKDMEIGDIFLPTDHLNMSVLNSNTGKNIDKWGQRFYDVSKCYHQDLNLKFKEVLNKKGGRKVWNNHMLFESNTKPFAGLAEQKYCEGVGEVAGNICEAVSFQGHSELMTMRHMDFENTFKSLYVGVVFDK